MAGLTDETHDPDLRTWVPNANQPGDFPIQNLPLATFIHRNGQQIGTRIGDFILPLAPWLDASDLTAFFRLSSSDRTLLRQDLSRALRETSPSRTLYPHEECRYLLPCTIGDYTDFYASLHHAQNVGALFRPNNPLPPNYRHLPIAYHGRSSSIVISGTEITRPHSQLGEGRFGPTEELDYEVELGAFLGPGNPMGHPIPIDQAENHLAALCLLNDWSARDIQRWEYQPLGPFLAKNFATTISPWLITLDALAPFRTQSPQQDRIELAYVRAPADTAFDIEVEAFLNTTRLSRAHFRDMYWTFAQMIAHHTINGCPLRPGNLIGSGTISGPQRENRGCLLELRSADGYPPFLHDGDQVTLRAQCHRKGFRSIGFGECSGIIINAHHLEVEL